MPELLIFGSFLCTIGVGLFTSILLLARQSWVDRRRDAEAGKRSAD